MTNFIQEGKKIDYANAGSAIASGDVVQFGSQIGVAVTDIAATTGVGPVLLEGVVELAKVGSQAWSQGDKIFWDHTNSRCTKTASSDADTVIGFAFEAAGSGAGVVLGKVKLGSGSPEKVVAAAALLGTLTGSATGTMVDVAAAACAGAATPTAAQVDTAIDSLETSTNLALLELQTKVNALIAALKVAGVMDS